MSGDAIFSHSQPRQSIGGRGLSMMTSIVKQPTLFRFPMIPTKEIILCLGELGLSIREDELLNPDNHKDSIRHTLESLAETFTGITREEMVQPAFSGLSKLDHPALHEESIPNLNSYRACQKLMEICGISSFSIKDFLTPTSKRLIHQLSGIINYAKFREERYTFMSDITEQRDVLSDRLNVARVKNHILNNNLAQLREKTSQEAAVIQQLEAENKEIEDKINILNEIQADVRVENGTLKTQNTAIKDDIAAKTNQLEELNIIKKRISSQIVNSPEKFRKQIQDVGHGLQAEIKDIKINEKKLREIATWIESVDLCQGDVTLGLNAIQELRAEVEKQKIGYTQLNGLKLEVNNKKHVLQDVSLNLQNIQRAEKRAVKKLGDLQKESISRNEAAYKTLEDLQRQQLEADKSKSQLRIRFEQTENLLAKTEKEFYNETAAMQHERDDIVSEYRTLENQVVHHLRLLRQSIEPDLADNL